VAAVANPAVAMMKIPLRRVREPVVIANVSELSAKTWRPLCNQLGTVPTTSGAILSATQRKGSEALADFRPALALSAFAALRNRLGLGQFLRVLVFVGISGLSAGAAAASSTELAAARYGFANDDTSNSFVRGMSELAKSFQAAGKSSASDAGAFLQRVGAFTDQLKVQRLAMMEGARSPASLKPSQVAANADAASNAKRYGGGSLIPSDDRRIVQATRLLWRLRKCAQLESCATAGLATLLGQLEHLDPNKQAEVLAKIVGHDLRKVLNDVQKVIEGRGDKQQVFAKLLDAAAGSNELSAIPVRGLATTGAGDKLATNQARNDKFDDGFNFNSAKPEPAKNPLAPADSAEQGRMLANANLPAAGGAFAPPSTEKPALTSQAAASPAPMTELKPKAAEPAATSKPTNKNISEFVNKEKPTLTKNTQVAGAKPKESPHNSEPTRSLSTPTVPSPVREPTPLTSAASPVSSGSDYNVPITSADSVAFWQEHLADLDRRGVLPSSPQYQAANTYLEAAKNGKPLDANLSCHEFKNLSVTDKLQSAEDQATARTILNGLIFYSRRLDEAHRGIFMESNSRRVHLDPVLAISNHKKQIKFDIDTLNSIASEKGAKVGLRTVLPRAGQIQALTVHSEILNTQFDTLGSRCALGQAGAANDSQTRYACDSMLFSTMIYHGSTVAEGVRLFTDNTASGLNKFFRCNGKDEAQELMVKFEETLRPFAKSCGMSEAYIMDSPIDNKPGSVKVADFLMHLTPAQRERFFTDKFTSLATNPPRLRSDDLTVIHPQFADSLERFVGREGVASLKKPRGIGTCQQLRAAYTVLQHTLLMPEFGKPDATPLPIIASAAPVYDWKKPDVSRSVKSTSHGTIVGSSSRAINATANSGSSFKIYGGVGITDAEAKAKQVSLKTPSSIQAE
jgi:hypothetical protein